MKIVGQIINTIPEAKIWKRFRPVNHSGAYRSFKYCERCTRTMRKDPFLGIKHEDGMKVYLIIIIIV